MPETESWRQKIIALCGGDTLEAMSNYAEAQITKAFDSFALWGWLQYQSPWLDEQLPGMTKEERFARATLNAARCTATGEGR